MEIHRFIIYLIFLWSYPSNCYDYVSLLVKLEEKRADTAFSLPKSKSEDRKEKAQYPDTNDYYKYPLCGNLPMAERNYFCYCGNITLSGIDLSGGDSFCCVPEDTHCTYSKVNWRNSRNSDVICENGKVTQKTELCNSKCWNSYESSELIYSTSKIYCRKEDFCFPVRSMCSGTCEEERDLCSDNADLRCSGDGYGFTSPPWEFKYINTKFVKNHKYCTYVDNDGAYDGITRQDEKKIVANINKRSVNYTKLEKCFNRHGAPGARSIDDKKQKCMENYRWCVDYDEVLPTTDGPISTDNPEICNNNTAWMKMNISCYYYVNDKLVSAGLRCTGAIKHCYYPWYYRQNARPGYFITCKDNSDRVFPINTSCSTYT